MLRGLLALQGCKIGRRHVTTLMRRMGIFQRLRHQLHHSHLQRALLLRFRLQVVRLS
jgi:hypothetical protein